MIPVKGKEPGAFVITSRKDGQKYIMSERTFNQVIATMGEVTFEKYLTAEWLVLTEEEIRLTEEEIRLAEEIRRGVSHG